jgi:arsenite-transporting ATPase
MVGPDLLADLCDEVYGDLDPADVLHTDEPMRVSGDGEGRMVLDLRLPYAEDRFDLARRDDDLIVTVGPHRRSIMLPQSLRRRRIVDAAFDGPTLRITFEEDGGGEDGG